MECLDCSEGRTLEWYNRRSAPLFILEPTKLLGTFYNNSEKYNPVNLNNANVSINCYHIVTHSIPSFTGCELNQIIYFF